MAERQHQARGCIALCADMFWKAFPCCLESFCCLQFHGALSPAEPGPQLTCTEHWRLFTALSCALAYIQSQLDLGAFHALMLHFLLEQNPTSLSSTNLQTGRINSPCSYLTLAEVLWETQPRHSRTSHHLTSSWDLPFCICGRTSES